ncbi:low temperature requirement protein A [Pseudanabaena sp. FACHB-2040]|uniref:low temperature requirement protein A n=1 Tax=Pseudanabaena sp. FACHB-2040 TaxID=2692859 RepID=UPI001683159C|nr:low temperature requirement protein A [Pseudanabaena sp. FACHB-2040]MBD2257611.1 low temperature requirement protein A [Pseudanabaena sp. FACHB-2040]
MLRALWQPPTLRRDGEESEERRATWLELFYDLVFVAAIGELAHYLRDHLSGGGLMSFALFFFAIWWCWVGATFYATRFDNDAIPDRLLTFLQMGIVAAMAVNAHHGLEDGSVGFALCYVLFRGLLVVQYLIAGHFIAEARGLTTRYALGFGSSVMLWLASIFVPVPWRYVLWAVGMLVDLGTPLTARKLVVLIPPSLTHIPERIGLFTIIVLGESIIAVVNGLEELQWSFEAGLTAFLGLSLAFSLWWLYFDSADGSPLQSMKRGQMTIGLTWLYAHLPLAASLTAAGVGVGRMIENGPGMPPETAERWLLCGAIALSLSVLAGIHWMTCTLGTPRFRRVLSTYRLTAAALILLLAVSGSQISSLNLVAILTLICAIQVGLDLWRRAPQLAVKQG